MAIAMLNYPNSAMVYVTINLVLSANQVFFVLSIWLIFNFFFGSMFALEKCPISDSMVESRLAKVKTLERTEGLVVMA